MLLALWRILFAANAILVGLDGADNPYDRWVDGFYMEVTVSMLPGTGEDVVKQRMVVSTPPVGEAEFGESGLDFMVRRDDEIVHGRIDRDSAAKLLQMLDRKGLRGLRDMPQGPPGFGSDGRVVKVRHLLYGREREFIVANFKKRDKLNRENGSIFSLYQWWDAAIDHVEPELIGADLPDKNDKSE